MHLSLPSQLEQGRRQYLDHYRRVIQQIRQSEPQAAVELMLIIGDGSNPHGSRFNLPLRIDVVSGDTTRPKLTAAQVEEIPNFRARALPLHSGRVAKVAPFPWHRCDVRFQGPDSPWDLVLAWFERWFDRQETHVQDELGLSGVVHSMSEPTRVGAALGFTVDFGSAPMDAFSDLLQTLDSMGITGLRVGHYPDEGGA